MEPQFEINQSIQFQSCHTSSSWDNGVITTIFTNRTPIQYVVQTSNNEKLYLNEQQIKAIKTIKSAAKTPQVSYNIEFQRILSQLIMQKNEDQLIEELKSLLKRITPQQVMQEQNGAKIIYTTYQFLIMRKPSILRNYPLLPQIQYSNNSRNQFMQSKRSASKFELNLITNSLQLQRRFIQAHQTQKQLQKQSRKMTQIYDDSEKKNNLLPSMPIYVNINFYIPSAQQISIPTLQI